MIPLDVHEAMLMELIIIIDECINIIVVFRRLNHQRVKGATTNRTAKVKLLRRPRPNRGRKT